MTNNNGRISSQNIKKIEDELGKCDAVLIGCGMGCDHDTAAIAEAVLKSSAVPVIIDADGINALKDNINVIKSCLSPVVINPSPGPKPQEFSAAQSAKIEKDRKAACKAIFEKTGAVVVLKGSRTIVTANGIDFYVNLTGNPGYGNRRLGGYAVGYYTVVYLSENKAFFRGGVRRIRTRNGGRYCKKQILHDGHHAHKDDRGAAEDTQVS